MIEDQISKILSKEPNMTSILIFGSEAKGTVHEKSDIDIAILYEKGKEPDKIKKKPAENQEEYEKRKNQQEEKFKEFNAAHKFLIENI